MPAQQQAYSSSNSNFQANDIVRLRLDVEGLLKRIELFLANKKIVTRATDDSVEEVEISMGEPLMNDRGIQTLMGGLTLMIGPHTVQGNLDKDRFENLMEEVTTYIARDIIVERMNWDVKIDDVPIIIDTITWAIYIFMSRTIDDGERQSYANTLRSVQTNTMERGSKGIMRTLFGGG